MGDPARVPKLPTTRPDVSATLLSKCQAIRDNGKQLIWPEQTKRGVVGSPANAKAFLEWAGVEVVYDEFERRTLVTGIPDLRDWDDAAIRTVRFTAAHYGMRQPAEFWDEVVQHLSGQYRFHPVRLFLDRLTWDGVERIDTWLRDFVHVEDNEYTRTVGAQFLIAAVRRVRRPGCKFDTLMVLEGAQGSGKSSIGPILAGTLWFGDSVPIGASPKLTVELTAAKWIVELPELTGISKRQVEEVKAFLSRQVDEAREAYGRKASRVPRQFVLYGSTNDDAYLIDATGNRRFLPIKCLGGAGSIDLGGLSLVRDQLWAEAAHRESQDCSISLPRHLWGDANTEQEARRLVHPIEERLTELLEEFAFGTVAVSELRKALGLQTRNMEIRQAKHVADTMKRLGWEEPKNALKLGPKWRKRVWIKGENYRGAILTYQSCFDQSEGVFVPKTVPEVVSSFDGPFSTDEGDVINV